MDGDLNNIEVFGERGRQTNFHNPLQFLKVLLYVTLNAYTNHTNVVISKYQITQIFIYQFYVQPIGGYAPLETSKYLHGWVSTKKSSVLNLFCIFSMVHTVTTLYSRSSVI